MPAGPAFGHQQVIPAIALVDVRRLGKAPLGSFEDEPPRADQPARPSIQLLRDDTREALVRRTMVPQHVEQPAAPVIVVEQGRIEPAAIEVDRIRPLSVDPVACHEIIMKVAQRHPARAVERRLADALHVRVEQPEAPIRVADVRCPDPAGIRIPAHVEL